jgi:ankyrin repeat protein
LIKHGAKVDAVDFHKNTALHYVKKGAIALSLIKNQADVNARDEYGSTPLHIGNCYYLRNSIRYIINL